MRGRDRERDRDGPPGGLIGGPAPGTLPQRPHFKPANGRKWAAHSFIVFSDRDIIDEPVDPRSRPPPNLPFADPGPVSAVHLYSRRV
jgi:hypothetical protein